MRTSSGTEREHIRTQSGIARGQRQDMASPRCADDEDPGVRGLTGVRECRRQLAHIRQLSVAVCGYQQATDLALDGVVAPLSNPAPNQASAIVEEVLRRPCVVAER